MKVIQLLYNYYIILIIIIKSFFIILKKLPTYKPTIVAISTFDSDKIGLYIETTNANKIFAYFLKVAYLLGLTLVGKQKYGYPKDIS